ncbi:CRISPR-associated endonuclease Cas1 [Ectothiorhodospira shaposhnikovii]|uniref:CRISPR-associated endonuclease Cas1 n=1 Tax=Ectothiorhodospira shaposhnikovii TaxID=1054 RepID=UPI001904311B|nr:CRISPR-associated endonuclease Cas1 [Ectothiorhodospira shaposhnikovii]
MATRSIPSSRPRMAAPDRKPLYLLGPEAREVRARPTSLWIRGANAAVNLPLSRLERIVSGGRVRWDSEAICRCLEHGIPITWVTDDHQVAGTVYPPRHQGSLLHDALQMYLQRCEWQILHENWIAHRRMEVLLTWRGRMRAAGREVSASGFEQLQRDYVRHNRLPLLFVDESHAWCHNLVCRHLHMEGLEPVYWDFGGEAMNLATDLADLFWAEMNLCCGTLPAEVEEGAEAVLMFESWAARHEVRIHHHLGDLKRHVQVENHS